MSDLRRSGASAIERFERGEAVTVPRRSRAATRAGRVPWVLWVRTEGVGDDGKPCVVIQLRSDNQAGDEIVLTAKDVRFMARVIEFREGPRT